MLSLLCGFRVHREDVGLGFGAGRVNRWLYGFGGVGMDAYFEPSTPPRNSDALAIARLGSPIPA
jgi:hypothetical protein